MATLTPASLLRFRIVRGDMPTHRIVLLYACLLAFNVGAWVAAYIAFAGNAVLFSAAVVAYLFGLRHAFDADHIASIDSVTRKLMQQGEKATTVGLYFAIGHSLTVAVFVVLIALFASWGSSFSVGAYAGSISTMISASFLLAMAAVNIAIAVGTYKLYLRFKRGAVFEEETFDSLMNGLGFLSKLLRPLFKLVTKSWHMMLIGALFGLGFDTATEASLFGIAGAEAVKGAPLALILIYPALFSAGMALMDTTDGVLMTRAYGWANREPLRRLYYNLTITTISAAVALLIAGIEIAGLIADQFHLEGSAWSLVASLNEHWEQVGLAVVAVFVCSWLLFVAFQSDKSTGSTVEIRG